MLNAELPTAAPVLTPASILKSQHGASFGRHPSTSGGRSASACGAPVHRRDADRLHSALHPDACLQGAGRRGLDPRDLARRLSLAGAPSGGTRKPLQGRKAPYQPPVKTDTTRSLPGARQALQLTSRGQSPCGADKAPGKSVAPHRFKTSGGIARTGRTTTDRAAKLHGVLSRNLAHDPCTRKSNAAVGSQRNMSAFDEFYCSGKYHPT
jgi:hypothetical protein